MAIKRGHKMSGITQNVSFSGRPSKMVKNGVLPLFGKSVILCILNNAQNGRGR